MKNIFKQIVSIISINLCFMGCSSSAKVSTVSSNDLQGSYYASIDYDNYGLPILREPMKEKPVKPGLQYIIVPQKKGFPEEFVTVAVMSPDKSPSIKNIYNVIYSWTGKGFETGYQKSRELIKQSGDLASTGYEPFIGAIIATPFMAIGGAIFIVCGTGGFVIGMAAAVPATIDEVKKLGLNNNEMILCITKLYYDNNGRMVRGTTYSTSDEKSLLYETKYYYKGSKKYPFKTVCISNPDKKERVIYYSK
jgi:hypothetical protein